ncbi:hypothetical protein PR202_ga02746 [Eleusine coracana subsp. coracana]|uniref:Uncharacterized protein n=1 Tax=Eleusine coracana subsp. coracana TaxID=191504 RepID=A0AAV5BKJ5_ELECO|nr:hypothetical protein PR202_ga02746 [Eleusine coracana subsp. coracana]
MWYTASEHQKKGFNSLVALGAWIIWTHRNACVFDGAAPSITMVIAVEKDVVSKSS